MWSFNRIDTFDELISTSGYLSGHASKSGSSWHSVITYNLYIALLTLIDTFTTGFAYYDGHLSTSINLVAAQVWYVGVVVWYADVGLVCRCSSMVCRCRFGT